MELNSKNFYFFLAFLLLSAFVQVSTFQSKHLKKRKFSVKIKRRFNAFNSTKFNSFILQTPKGKKTATINFNLRKTSKITSLGLINHHFALFSNNITHFIHKNGNSKIKGRKVLTNKFSSKGKVKYNKVDQWRLVAQDVWNKNLTSNGWNFNMISKCNQALFFGGQCLLSKQEISKEFLNLPKHTMIRIEAFYHHIGNWNNNSGYLRIIHPKKSGQILWTNFCRNRQQSRFNNLCGYQTCKINVPISVTVPHKKKKLNIAFGADLNHDHSCEASYAISDIKIYIR